MTRRDFTQAFRIASSEKNLDHVDIGFCLGFGLPDFHPVICTVEQLAKVIRYQAQMLNGNWDNDAMMDIMIKGKKNFIVVGGD